MSAVVRGGLMRLATVSLLAVTPALQAAPDDDLELQLARAEIAYGRQEWTKAFESLRRVLDREPGHPQAWLRVGNLWQRHGDPVRAIDAYRMAAAALVADPPRPGEAVHAHKALINLAALTDDLLADALRRLDAGASTDPGVETARRTLLRGLKSPALAAPVDAARVEAVVEPPPIATPAVVPRPVAPPRATRRAVPAVPVERPTTGGR